MFFYIAARSLKKERAFSKLEIIRIYNFMKFILWVFIVLCMGGYSAFAESYKIIAQQTPHGEISAMTCTPENKPCFITLHEKGGDIDIAANFAKDGAVFQFMKDREYLAVNREGNTTLLFPLTNGKGQKTVNLFKLAPIMADQELLVLRGYPVVTTINIAVEMD